jgi:hypothetical protein
MYRGISGFAPPPLLYPVCRRHLERNAAPCCAKYGLLPRGHTRPFGVAVQAVRRHPRGPGGPLRDGRAGARGQGPRGRGQGAGAPTYIPDNLPKRRRKGHAHAFGGHAHALGVRLDSPGMSVASRAACRCASGGNRTYTMPPSLTLCNVPRDKRLRTAPLLYPVCRWHLNRHVSSLQ